MRNVNIICKIVNEQGHILNGNTNFLEEIGHFFIYYAAIELINFAAVHLLQIERWAGLQLFILHTSFFIIHFSLFIIHFFLQPLRGCNLSWGIVHPQVASQPTVINLQPLRG